MRYTSRTTGKLYQSWAYGTAHVTLRALPLVEGGSHMTITNEDLAKNFEPADAPAESLKVETIELARILATCSVWRDDVFGGVGKVKDVMDGRVIWGDRYGLDVYTPMETFLREFTRVNMI